MKTAFWVLIFISPVNGLVQPVQDNVTLVKHIIEAFNKHDWQKVLSYYAAEARFYDPAFESPVQGKGFIAGHYKKIQDFIPDVRDEVKAMYAFGDTVVVEICFFGYIYRRGTVLASCLHGLYL